jgi:signal transduction histidine kinase/CheY-like chemotaxis protein
MRELASELEHVAELADVRAVFFDEALRVRKLAPPGPGWPGSASPSSSWPGVGPDAPRQYAGREGLPPRTLPTLESPPRALPTLEELAEQWSLPGLRADVFRVLRDGVSLDREVALDARTFLLRAVPYRPSERVEGVVLCLRDVSSIKRSERELAERETEAQRSRFIAMLSHELRNPLAAIAGAADILIEASADQRAQRVAAALVRQVGHVKALLDEMLDAGRAAAGGLGARAEPVDLCDVLACSVESMRATMQRRTIDVLVCAPNTPCVVAGDRARLEQALSIVIANALRFSRPGGAVCAELELHGGDVLIRVRDEGVGLRPDELERVFAPYYQRSQGLDRREGGLGLGLTIARAIVEEHGGSLRASSEGDGRGSTFEFRLPRSSTELGAVGPLARGASEASSSPEATSSVASSKRRRQRLVAKQDAEEEPLKVLVVEDQDDNRDLLEMLLSMRGHETFEAADGESAIAIALRESPDLALIDIGLPGVDGYEVARRIRALEQRGRITLVALTGYGQAEDRARAIEAGFDRHLVKPLLPDELDALLRSTRAECAARSDPAQPRP